MSTYTRPSLPTAAVGLAAFGVAAAAAAAVGGLAAASAADQYGALVQPAWAPPAWLFGPVWTVLYVTIAVAGWLVWRTAGWSGARTALSVFAAQLVLNALWTPLFFGAGLFGVAFVEIVLLWLTIVATIVLFARHSRLAAGLLVPYLAWVTFASALNLAIWVLN
ncbi:tryptophan-rich sensory protein [Pseudonocardia petroleophila]|uniref:Tryptophan-rich sensory protein n=1 Tax=Pseudonocardia petroleophila TaxID=37331 RepID=A0A7G7MK25_9PSEU|nr:tryptophan-rich sensory protein [Pseudonocardia petroleophila]